MTMSEQSEKGTDHRFHHPKKPLTCPECGAHVVSLRDGECLECYDGLVTPTDSLIENDWSPEKFPEEVR